MKKITKKEFKELHNNNKIKLLCSTQRSKEEVATKIKSIKNLKDYIMPLNNVYLNSNHTIYKEDNLIFVESINTIMQGEEQKMTSAYIIA